MEPANAHNIPYLDGWRGLAILCLLVGHFFPVPGINLGAVGVNLFFVLSGFLMARILFLRPTPLPLFYKRRIARVLPSVCVFIVAIVVGYTVLGLPLNWSETFSAASFTSNYLVGTGAPAAMPFGHTWSLSVEEHSYILLSLLALATRAGVVRTRVAVGTAAFACVLAGVFYWSTYHGPDLGHARWLRSEVSAYGILVSAWLLVCFEGKTLPRLPAALFAALGIVALGAHWWRVALPVMTTVGVGALALTINLLRAAPPRVQALLSFAPLRWFGTWSFSIYLWQQPFYLSVHRVGLPAAAGASLAVAAGILAYYLIERPTRTWLNRHWATAKQGVATFAPMSSASEAEHLGAKAESITSLSVGRRS
jgi:peptidoglycan/LPS O-acetylase OafA/YrhL